MSLAFLYSLVFTNNFIKKIYFSTSFNYFFKIFAVLNKYAKLNIKYKSIL